MQAVHIVVASKNPVKAAAIEGAWQLLFPDQPCRIEMVGAASGVSDQPMSDEETRRGARNRVADAREAVPSADVWAGLEGGIAETDSGMHAFAWIVCVTATLEGESRTATFPLPEELAKLIRDGVELGHADDIVFGRDNSKQKEGAVGILTDGLIDRRLLYQHAAVMALIPMKNGALFQ